MRLQPHKPQRDTVLFCRKAEAARCSEIERARVPRNLPDHAGKIAAFEPLFEREESVFRGLGFDMDQSVA